MMIDSRWMISYQMQACYRTADGMNRNAPVDTFIVTWMHPAEFVVSAKSAVLTLQESPYTPETGPQSVDDVLIVYSAIEIPYNRDAGRDLVTKDDVESAGLFEEVED